MQTIPLSSISSEVGFVLVSENIKRGPSYETEMVLFGCFFPRMELEVP